MARPPALFEQIVGDTEAFRLMLDGALKDCASPYLVWLPDAGFLSGREYHAALGAFFGLLFGHPHGERLYRAQAEAIAYHLDESRAGSLVFTCEVTGLRTVAVPLRVADTLAAVVFCCIARPTDPDEQRQFKAAVGQLEGTLGLAAGQLVQYTARLPDAADPALDKTIERVQRVIAALSRLGADRLALQQAQQQEHWRMQAIRALQVANQQLNDLSISWDAFWRATARLLADLAPIIGAVCGLVLVPGRGARRDMHIATAVCGLPSEQFTGRLYRLDDALLGVIARAENFHILHTPNDDLAHGPVRRSIVEQMPEIGAQLGHEVLIPMFFEDQRNGLVVFFLNSEPAPASDVLVIDSSTGDSILAQSGSLIGAAFNNRQFVQRRHQQHKFKRAWLETVTHQFVAPLSAVQGHAELLTNRLARWENKNPKLFANWPERHIEQFWNSLTAIERTAQYASRLAYNFSRVVYQDKELGGEVELSVAADLTGELIQIARDFQGSAREHRILKVEVDTPSVSPLNGKVAIITTDDLFRQAIGNLVDNAVKYSFENTAIILRGRLEKDWGVIEVVNEGIRLAPGEETRIFEYEYRTPEARATYAPGTGIGLSVARDIIVQHGGTLTARPSVPVRKLDDRQSWLTTFTIRLPLLDSDGS